MKPAGFYPISRIRLRCVLLIALVLTFTATSACVQLEECPGTDITCSANGWLLYLRAANATNPTPALCRGGTANAAYFTYIGGGGSGAETMADVCATRDGGMVTAGSADADIPTLNGKTAVNGYTSNTDALIVKLDATGAVDWYSFAGAAGNSFEFSGVTETSDGGYIAVGQARGNMAVLEGKAPIVTYQSVAPNRDMLVVRYNSVGSVLWWSYLGSTGTNADNAQSVVELADGGFVVGGFADELSGMPVANLSTYSGSNLDTTYVKFRDPGVIEWYLTVGSGANEQCREIIATADGGFLAAGLSLTSFINIGGQTPILPHVNLQDYVVMKISAAGVLEWHTFLGEAGVHEGDSITELADGGIIVAGNSKADIATLDGKTPLTAYDADDIYIVRLNSNGVVEWHTNLPSPGTEVFGHVAALEDGSFLITGEAPANIPTIGGLAPLNAFAGGSDILLAKYSGTGTLIWYSFVGGAGTDKGIGLAATLDGGFALSGQSDSNITNLGSLTPILAYDNSSDGFVLRGGANGPF